MLRGSSSVNHNMKKFIKENWFKLSIIITVLIIVTGLFFWYEYRPYKAKKDCAWVKNHSDAMVYKPATGNKDDQDTCVSKCLEIYDEDGSLKLLSLGIFKNRECANKCSSLYSSEQKAEPEKDWWEQASEKEYKECLRGRGF